jgi:hypothetical protein
LVSIKEFWTLTSQNQFYKTLGKGFFYYKTFDGKFFEMMMTYHPHNLEIQNIISKCSNFKIQLLDKGVIMCMTYEQSCGLWYKKLKFKIVIIFQDDLKLWSFFKTKRRI